MELHQKEKSETEIKDDPAARALLEGAFEKTERWPKGFAGFTTDILINTNGSECKGRVEITPGKEAQIHIDDEALLPWAKNQIGMMAVHRGYRSFEESDGKYALTLGEGTASHPLGQLVHINGDGMNSHYRIRDGRIMQINRTMGQLRFTINIQDSMVTENGKHLTTHYVVYYFSAQDSSIIKVEGFRDRHVTMNGTYLPKQRQVLTSDKGEVVVRQTEFSNHRLL